MSDAPSLDDLRRCPKGHFYLGPENFPCADARCAFGRSFSKPVPAPAPVAYWSGEHVPEADIKAGVTRIDTYERCATSFLQESEKLVRHLMSDAEHPLPRRVYGWRRVE